MKRPQKYLSSEAHGYLQEAEACSLILKDLERISAKLQRRIDKEWNSQENRTPNMPGYATCACADSHRLRLTSGGR